MGTCGSRASSARRARAAIRSRAAGARRAARLTALLALGAMLGCARDGAPARDRSRDAPADAGGAAEGRIVIVTSVTPHAGLVERIGGDRVEAIPLIPPGASCETHEATIGQLTAVGRARIYVRVGHPALPFEQDWLDTILEQNPGLLVVDLSDSAAEIEGDPHLWLSPREVRKQVRQIAGVLERVDPEGRAAFAERANALLREIAAVDAELEDVVRHARRRSFLVFHPAWGYLARDYGLEQIAIEQGGKEPGAGSIDRLIATARARGIRTVFIDRQSDPRYAALIAEALGAKTVVLDPLARDFVGNMRDVARRLAEALNETEGSG
jgi:zinc transport system substrate-binding protein